MKRIWIHLSLITVASVLFAGLLLVPAAHAVGGSGCSLSGCCAYLGPGAPPDINGQSGCGTYGNCICLGCNGGTPFYIFTSGCKDLLCD